MYRVILFMLCITSIVADLYNSSDPLVLLNSKNFHETILSSENGWIIEFYNSWCGHCINFAPKWREFSSEIKDWNHTFKVGVIDCSDEENVSICRDYEVMGYPSVRLFGAYTKKGDLGVEVHNRSVKEMQEAIIDFITEKQRLHLGASSWVNLLNYSGLIKDVFENVSSQVTHAVLIIEKADSKLGSHSILDLGNYPMVYIRKMDPDTKEMLDLKLPVIPEVIVLNRDMNRSILKEVPSSREELTALIINHLKLPKKLAEMNSLNSLGLDGVKQELEKTELEGAGDGKPEEINSERLNYDDELPDIAYNKQLHQVYMVDIENAISYALRHEVILRKTISGESLTALKDFINVLIKYLPMRPQIGDFFLKLREWMLKHEETLTGEEFQKAIPYFESSSSKLPDMQPWQGCQGSQPTFRGYPCSLWVLFHTVTVNAYMEHSSYDPQEPLKAIHGYVKYFFSCEHCSKHFQEMYSLDAEYSVRAPGDEVLWLWKAHNKVNERIKGELSEDPKHPKQRFPSKISCPKCWKDEGDLFDSIEILQYLKSVYGRNSISLKKTQDFSKVNNDLGKSNLQNNRLDSLGKSFLGKETVVLSRDEISFKINSWGFNNTDLNLCVILYLFSTLMIAAGYFMFILKRRLRRKKVFEFYKLP